MDNRPINHFIVSFYSLNSYTHSKILRSFSNSLGYVEIIPNTFVWSTHNNKRYWNQVFQYHLQGNYPFIITDFNAQTSEGWLHNATWERIKTLP